MCRHRVALYNRRRRQSMAHYLSHADSLHHHVDQNSNRVRYSTDDLVRTFEMPTYPLERYLKLLNRWRQRTDMRLIHLNWIARPAIGMTIGSNMDLRNLMSAVWPSSAVSRCSSSWRRVRPYDDDTLNMDLMVWCKDMDRRRPMNLTCHSSHCPLLAASMSSCLQPPMMMTNWSNLLNFDDD